MSRIKSIFGPKTRNEPTQDNLPAAQLQPVRQAPAAPAELPLGFIGQRSEMVRQRIDGLGARLEDLLTLKDDFQAILEPLTEISQELSNARMRMAELERSLQDERQAAAASRNGLADMTHRFTTLENSHAETLSRAEQAQSELRESNLVLEQQRQTIANNAVLIETYERQVFEQSEQNKLLSGENKALRAEAQAADSAISRLEHELSATQETLSATQQDCMRLQLLSEEQTRDLSQARAELEEATVVADAARQALDEVQGQLGNEIARREHAETQLAAESTAYRANRASLEMKVESATHRVTVAEQMLAQSRAQLKEKDDAHRIADRTARESLLARAQAERIAQNLQSDIAKQTERVLEMQKARTELEGRCDMLGKAIAAKDAMIEQQAERNSVLTERIAELTHRHQAERAELELTNRRLMEDLESERSERSLVQGALEIARESRTALQKQHEALKRGWRSGQVPEEVEGTADGEQTAKIHPFVPNLK